LEPEEQRKLVSEESGKEIEGVVEEENATIPEVAVEDAPPIKISAGEIERELAAAGLEIDLRHCYSCARCSSVCKAAFYASKRSKETPRSLIYQISLGLEQLVMEGEFITLCSGCGRCVEQCPQTVKFPEMVRVLRRLALEAGRINRFAARVSERICMHCGACVKACPISAVQLVDTGKGLVARVDVAECRGCGSCSAACPNGAIQQGSLNDLEILQLLTGRKD
jgi:heterodisulfide reductase subunit C